MKSYLTTVSFIAFYLSAASQPGTLDKSFGEGGRVVNKTINGYTFQSVLQPDGKIITGGTGGYYKGDKLISGATAIRYNRDGSPDLDFGDSGRTAYDFGQTENSKVVYSIALQKDGKILEAVQNFTDASVAVVRLNTDGSVDESFGSKGRAIMLDPQAGSYSGEDMALLPDGRIVVTGNVSYSPNEQYPFLTCFTPAGVVDKGFGGEGNVLILNPQFPVTANCVAATREGKIVVGGQYFTLDKTLVWRFTGDGTPDESFGKNGVAEMSFEKKTYTPGIQDIVVTDENTIVAAGYAYPNRASYPSFMVSRFLENGTPDDAFGTGGHTVTTYGGSTVNSTFKSVSLQANGKIVATGGASPTKGTPGFATMRYDKDGILDSTFGENGIAATDFASEGLVDATSSAILVQPDGRIAVSGSGNTKDYKYFMALARYYGDDAGRKQQIITRVKRWLQHHGITWQTDDAVRYYSVQRSTDGGITYRQVAKYYNSRQPLLTYEDGAIAGTALYRVAVISKDGSRGYSNSVQVGNEARVQVFPNPVRNIMQVQGLPAEGRTSLSVSDLSGTVRASAITGGSTASINTNGLEKGTYLLKVQTGQTVTTQAFVKQ